MSTVRYSTLGRFLVLFLLCATLNSFSSDAVGQASRARRVADPQQPAPSQPTTQTPKPTPPPGRVAQPPAKSEQPPVPDQVEPLRINSNLVAVPVSVTDATGQPVNNLRAEDFQLTEEGQAQEVTNLSEPGKTPVELALLLDVSGSVQERFQFERKAASRFLQQVLKPKDVVTVFSFGLTTRLAVARTDNVARAVNGTLVIAPSKEATAFFDAVASVAQYLSTNAQPGTRRVLVVISDGEDNQSKKHRLADALREVQRADCLFYAINPSGPSIRLNKISLRGQEGLTSLAGETGGVAFLPDKLEDLEIIFRQIVAELQAQYLLGYYPNNETADGRFRKIVVRVAKRPELRVRARQGYYAQKG